MIFSPGRYALIFLGLSIAVSVIFFLLDRFTGFGGGSGGSVVVPMMAAMFEAQTYQKNKSEPPAKSVIWKAAAVMSLIGLAVSVAIAAIAGLTIVPDLFSVIGEIGAGILIGALVFAFVLFTLVSRIGYGLGIKTQLKVQK